MAAEPLAIRAQAFHCRHEDGTELHFENLDMQVRRGEKVALLGSNGSGKTTLLMHLAGLYGSSSQTGIEVLGCHPVRDFRRLRRRIGTVLQNPERQILAPTVRDDIGLSLRGAGMPEAQLRRRVDELLEQLHIEALADRVPHYLSGGHKAKVAIAGALALEPELLVLDEPFADIDPLCTHELVALVERLNRERGTTIIMAIHDVETVATLADTVYLLSAGGSCAARGTPREIFSQPEVLERCHVRAPVLGLLRQELARRGVALDLHLRVDEAVEQLMSHLKANAGGGG